MQTCASPMFAVSVFVSSPEICSADLERLVLLLFSTPLALRLFLSALLPDCLSSKEMNLLETSHFELRVPRSLSVFLCLLLSVSVYLSVCLFICLFLSHSGSPFVPIC